MGSEKELYESVDFFSSQLSERSRTICFGVLALSWGIYIAPSGESLSAISFNQLIPIVLISLITLLLDFLQYFIGFLNARYFKLLKHLIIVQDCIFFLKIFGTMSAAFLLVLSCLRKIIA
jgi:hypothetical protein